MKHTDSASALKTMSNFWKVLYLFNLRTVYSNMTTRERNIYTFNRVKMSQRLRLEQEHMSLSNTSTSLLFGNTPGVIFPQSGSLQIHCYLQDIWQRKCHTLNNY